MTMPAQQPAHTGALDPATARRVTEKESSAVGMVPAIARRVTEKKSSPVGMDSATACRVTESARRQQFLNMPYEYHHSRHAARAQRVAVSTNQSTRRHHRMDPATARRVTIKEGGAVGIDFATACRVTKKESSPVGMLPATACRVPESARRFNTATMLRQASQTRGCPRKSSCGRSSTSTSVCTFSVGSSITRSEQWGK